jgi:polyribonucleotide 5'-hydroxyl-kinase
MSLEEETHHELRKEEELRVEVAHGRFVHVTLTDGTAEIFGAEIAKGAAVKLPGGKHAIFTWSGASLTLRGTPEHCYAASETPMVTYANVEGVLEKRREKARADPTTFDGPRVALVGPTDVGKSSVSKILCNYAVRKGWHPLFVDLDLGQNGIATPATVGAVPVDRTIDPTEGFANARDLPLVYFHGDASPGNNPELYMHLIENLSAMIDKRNETNKDAKSSGIVVNTAGWVDGVGYKLLLRALDALKITDVLVIGQERLHAELKRDFFGKTVERTNQPIEVWKLPKSGGVVERSPAFRRASRDAAIRAYFYGADGDLRPSSTPVDFGKVSVFKIGSGPRAPSSALPIGQKTSADPLRVSTVAPSMGLLNAVLAVSHGKTQTEILNQNVAGFIFVTEVDMANGRFTYTSPAGSGALPSRNLVLGTLKWIET